MARAYSLRLTPVYELSPVSSLSGTLNLLLDKGLSNTLVLLSYLSWISLESILFSMVLISVETVLVLWVLRGFNPKNKVKLLNKYKEKCSWKIYRFLGNSILWRNSRYLKKYNIFNLRLFTWRTWFRELISLFNIQFWHWEASFWWFRYFRLRIVRKWVNC